MEFSDTFYAASMFLLCYVLLFIPLHQYIGFTTFLMPNSIIVALLISGVITGAVFSSKIAGQRARYVGKPDASFNISVFFVFISNVIDWTAFQEYHSSMTAGQ